MYVSNERSYDKEFSINLRYSENLDGELLLSLQLVQKKRALGTILIRML